MPHDLRLAIRLLVKSPGFSAAAIATLALGIGATTAIFSVVNSVLLRPAPVADLDRLVMVWETDRNSGTSREPASVPDFLDFAARARSLDAIAAVMAGDVTLTGAGEPVQLAALRVSHALLPVLGIEPLAGRQLAAAEDVPNGPASALISESLWRRTFAGDPAIAGRVLRLDDRPYTVVGVVPDTADFGVLQVLAAAAYGRAFADRRERTRIDVWTALQADPRTLPRETHPIFMIGRLAPGATAASAQDELAIVAADLEAAYPVNRGRGVNVEPFADVVFGPIRPTLYVLLGAVVLVLLIACVNVAGLLLARGTTRVREVAVRRALGATTGRLTRQFLIEGLLLTALAGAAGVLLAYFGVRGLVAVAPAGIPRLPEASIDLTMLATTLLVATAAGVAFALIPAVQARRVALNESLNDAGARGTGGPARARARGALVIGELALAIVLLAGAGLLIRSVWNLSGVDTGFRISGVLKAEYKLPASRYPADFRSWPNFQEQHAFTRSLLERVSTLPGVTSAAVAGNHPIDPGFTNSFAVVGRESEARAWPEISVRRVTPGYFETVGLPLVSGRLLAAADETTSAPVVVLNAAAAQRFFAERSALGARLRLYGAERTIVGVVKDEKFQGVAAAAPLAVYLPLSQAPSTNGAGVLLVRTPGDPAALSSAILTVIRERDPALAVFGVEPFADTVSRSTAERRFAMLLLTAFAALALALGAIGIHGVLSYEVSQRRREIGIRMALGAERSRILRQIVGQGLLLTAVGIVLGLGGAVALSRFLETMLFGVSERDPFTFGAVVLVLGSVALAAMAVPAWRATHVDPAIALREQ
jgi:predicted permease